MALADVAEDAGIGLTLVPVLYERAGLSLSAPGTEGNLGDGFTDIPARPAADVDLAMGSDSNVTRDWREESRWMAYGQRLRWQRRNVGAQPDEAARSLRTTAPQARPDTAASLYAARIAAGFGRAMGELWGDGQGLLA